MNASPNPKHDIAIVGAGLVGLTLALALVRSGAKVALIERQSPEQLEAEEIDGRTTALAASAKDVFDTLGIWPDIEPHGGPILDIRVTDRASPLHVHFAHSAIGDAPMGHIVENHILRRELLRALEQEPALTAYWRRSVTAIQDEGSSATLTLDDGTLVRTALIAGADGRGSAVRRMAGIGISAADYNETALVCTAYHETPHHGIAHERFLSGGPFAILPMQDSISGQHRSSIVWTETRSLAEHLLRLPKPQFEQQLRRRFGDFLGIVTVPGDIWSYPLSVMLAKRLTGPRLVLVGEAAHGMHPIAGQGFNVSIRDIVCLRETIEAALQNGRDPGDHAVLTAYARRRWPDILTMIAATDGLNRLFRSNLPPIALARRLGLASVNRMPLLKRQFQRHAMGLTPIGR